MATEANFDEHEKHAMICHYGFNTNVFYRLTLMLDTNPVFPPSLTQSLFESLHLFFSFLFFEIDRRYAVKGERKASQIHSYSPVQYKLKV